MIQVDNIWKADAGKFLIRKADGFVMGESLILGEDDSIENYEERAYTQEEYAEYEAQNSPEIFCEDFGGTPINDEEI